MNVLPLVFSFLIIFSCLCYTFLKEVKSFQLIELTLEGYNHTEKAIRNALIKRSYDKIKEDMPPGTPKSEQAPKKSYTCVSRREYVPPLETSKFYLKALSKAGVELSQHPLYEPLAELLRLLYKKTLFDKYPKSNKIEYRLVDALIKKMQKFPSAAQLSYLYPDDPELQKIFYKMLKGTNRYTDEAGIPPLSHFLSLENGDKAAHLGYASLPVLKALFGMQIASEILRIEEENRNSSQKQYALSKEELESLCLKDPIRSSLLTALQPYINYSKQVAKKKSLAKRDQRTGIGIEKEL